MEFLCWSVISSLEPQQQSSTHVMPWPITYKTGSGTASEKGNLCVDVYMAIYVWFSRRAAIASLLYNCKVWMWWFYWVAVKEPK